MNIGFVGIGKLGQSCAEMIAERHSVIGFDTERRFPANFQMANTIHEAVIGKDLVFVAVPTPHDPKYDGKEPTSHLPPKDFDYSLVIDVLCQIDTLVKSESTIVLISTVLPGTIRADIFPKMRNINLIYNPYLIAMGTVKWDMVNPEMIMIGTQDGALNHGVNTLRELYRDLMQNSPREILGTWEEIESLKVFYNTFISVKIGLVNMIQDVAEKLGHMNAEMVCDALASSNRRIMGPSYMKPGMGDGGACHPRDNIALRFLAQRLDLGYDLFDSVIRSREQQARNMARFLLSFNKPIIIVGKAYKPLVEYENGSSSILVGCYVEREGGVVHYLDEITGDQPPKDIGPCVYLIAHSPEVTYGNQLAQVEDFAMAKNLIISGLADEHSSVVVNTGNRTAITFTPGSIVVDPWRRIPPMPNIEVIHYGNTSNRVLHT
ncbi:MAG: UDP-glucose/GDP-mannose dehydrogenase family protein [Chloroflexi bacterium]|nr:UDP-glucose/GDP-mannose dehydrogenase family protein [Chloroflexota bacterium]